MLVVDPTNGSESRSCPHRYAFDATDICTPPLVIAYPTTTPLEGRSLAQVICTASPEMATELISIFAPPAVTSKPRPLAQASGVSSVSSQSSGGTGTWNCTMMTRPLLVAPVGWSGCQSCPRII